MANKKNNDLEVLRGLSSKENTAYTVEYRTKLGDVYEVDFDKEFSNSKLEVAIKDIVLINEFVSRNNGDVEVAKLLLAVAIQTFTDKRFINPKMDLLDKYNTYTEVAKLLGDITLEDDRNLLDAIITEFGKDNIVKLENRLTKTIGKFTEMAQANKVENDEQNL